ncbi:hypothetical protein [Faecalibaculum rodentium]
MNSSVPDTVQFSGQPGSVAALLPLPAIIGICGFQGWSVTL